jgi:hypothetical protein
MACRDLFFFWACNKGPASAFIFPSFAHVEANFACQMYSCLSIVTAESHRRIQFQFVLFLLHTTAEYNRVTCFQTLYFAPAHEMVDVINISSTNRRENNKKNGKP